MDRAAGHANGLDYVPRDGYIAMLHRGERVQTAVDASASRLGSGGRGGVVVDNSGQVINVGQGVSRAEMVAGSRQAAAESEARIMRRLRQQGITA